MSTMQKKELPRQSRAAREVGSVDWKYSDRPHEQAPHPAILMKPRRLTAERLARKLRLPMAVARIVAELAFGGSAT